MVSCFKSSRAYQTCKMIGHSQSLGIVTTGYSRIFKDIQEYWCIFSQTHRAQLGEEGKPPLPFFENRRKCLEFGLKKKSRDCVHLWVKFSIQNIVLTVPRRKNSQIFPCEVFFLVLTKCLSKYPSSTNLPFPEKKNCCASAHRRKKTL